jgi:two-component system NtrC family sensor kinase
VATVAASPTSLEGLGAAILDALPVSLYVVDRKLRVVAWNRLREQGPLGQPRGRVLGRPLSRVLPPGGFRTTAPLIRAVFSTGRPQQGTVETRGTRLFQVRRLPVLRGRRVTHVLSVFEDITEQRALEMRLIASDRLAFLGQLVAGVAHEISNPLAGIAGCAEILASLACKVEGQQDEVERFQRLIRDEVARCERIVRSLLGAARPQAGATADLAATVGESLRLLERHPAFHRIKVVSRTPGKLLAGIDPDSLKQVVMGLALNAARAMAGSGTLTVRGSRLGRQVVLDVLDTGPGVPPEIRPRIFEPFFTTDPSQGTGLGLAIARSLVRGRGGDLVCRSRRGRGGSFRVVLAAARP